MTQSYVRYQLLELLPDQRTVEVVAEYPTVKHAEAALKISQAETSGKRFIRERRA
jgi:hypothetical protein